MNTNGKRQFGRGIALMVTFGIWTWLITHIDVQPWGQNGTYIGFASFNCWFHSLTGAHMGIYAITDWLGLVPIFICIAFAGIGLMQALKRRSIFKVDR